MEFHRRRLLGSPQQSDVKMPSATLKVDEGTPAGRWLLHHKAAVLTTFLLACVWFERCVVGLADLNDMTEKQPIVLAAAGVHTMIAAGGMAVGHETLLDRDSKGTLLQASLVSFILVGLLHGLCLSYQVTPLHSAAIALFGELGTWVIGAASMTGWLAVSMLVPRSAIGRQCTNAPIFHAIAMLGAAFIHVRGAGHSNPLCNARILHARLSRCRLAPLYA